MEAHLSSDQFRRLAADLEPAQILQSLVVLVGLVVVVVYPPLAVQTVARATRHRHHQHKGPQAATGAQLARRQAAVAVQLQQEIQQVKVLAAQARHPLSVAHPLLMLVAAAVVLAALAALAVVVLAQII
jgi:hypothetical protein